MTNASQWLEITAAMRDRWPHAAMPEASIEQWGRDVSDLRAEHVLAAVEVFYREGREFPPNSGQIRAKIVELAIDAPEWSETIRILRELHATPPSKIIDPGLRVEDGHEVADPDVVYPRREAIERCHELIRAFIRDVTWEQIAPGADPEASTTAEAQLREKWNAYVVRAHRESTYGEIPTAGLRRLERLRHEPRSIGAAITEKRRELEKGQAA